MKTEFSWILPDKITVRLGRTSYGRQRTIFEDGHLLLILHEPPSADATDRTPAVFWRTPEGDWQYNGRPNGLDRLRRLVDEYEELEIYLEQEYKSAETSADLFELIERLAPLARASHNAYQALQTAREQVKHDADIIELRDEAYEMQRNFELLFGDAKSRLDYKIARTAEDDARRSREALQAQHRLNILAAIFFPLMSLCAVFGMDLPSGLRRHGIAAFWIIVLVGLALGLYLRSWVLQKRAREK